ncbi:MAG: hypothetical protein ACI9MR_002139 [Myxococcota bacterium]|jgi:hypothetical protein
MGLFGLGGSKVDRLKKRMMNQWGQASERQRAMHMLADIGDEEALAVLLQRFTFRIEGGITDEEEKQLGYDLLVSSGQRAIQPIETFVASNDGVYWPLKAFKEIAGTEQAVDCLLRALDSAEQVSIRVNEHRSQLVSNLRDFPHPRILERLRLLCHDPDDDVRIMAIDALLTYGEEEAKPVIADRLTNPDETNRIKSVVYEQLVGLGWSLATWREQLEEADLVPGHYRLGPNGAVQRAN